MNIDFVVVHWKFTLCAVVVLAAIPPLYRLYKMWLRRCSGCGSWWVKREHLMEYISDGFCWSTTTTTCSVCKKHKVVKPRHRREFTSIEWMWRRIFYRKQFIGYSVTTHEELYAEQCRAEQTLFLIHNFESKRLNLGGHKPKLDSPAVIELSPREKINARS